MTVKFIYREGRAIIVAVNPDGSPNPDFSGHSWDTGFKQNGNQYNSNKIIAPDGKEYYYDSCSNTFGSAILGFAYSFVGLAGSAGDLCFDLKKGSGFVYKSPEDKDTGKRFLIYSEETMNDVYAVPVEAGYKYVSAVPSITDGEITDVEYTFATGERLVVDGPSLTDAAVEEGSDIEAGIYTAGTEVTFFDKDGYRVWHDSYAEDGGSATREVNSKIAGGIGYIDAGVSYGCYRGNCDEPILFSPDGSTVCNDANEDGQCGGDEGSYTTDEYSNCGTNVECQQTLLGRVCLSDQCKAETPNRKAGQDFDRVLAGETEVQRTTRQVLSSLNHWNELSYLIFGAGGFIPDRYISYIDQWFAGSVLSQDYWVSQICHGTYEDLVTEGEAIIQTPSGILQASVSIQAEKSQQLDLVCQDNACPEGYSCEKDFCVDDNGVAGKNRLYKISWGVTSPQDVAFTPYINENGVAISFNVCFSEDKTTPGKCLYQRNGVTAGAIQLKNGDFDQDFIVNYSPHEYKYACIFWQQAPRTTGTGQLGDFASEPKDIPTLCYEIKEITAGSVDLTLAGQEQATQGTSQSVTGGDVSRVGDW